MSLTNAIIGHAWTAVRWAAGCGDDVIPPAPADDDLEPYCGEGTLIQRQQSGGVLDAGVEKAVRKIGARYGAAL
jgi:hypothetical protein